MKSSSIWFSTTKKAGAWWNIENFVKISTRFSFFISSTSHSTYTFTENCRQQQKLRAREKNGGKFGNFPLTRVRDDWRRRNSPLQKRRKHENYPRSSFTYYSLALRSSSSHFIRHFNVCWRKEEGEKKSEKKIYFIFSSSFKTWIFLLFSSASYSPSSELEKSEAENFIISLRISLSCTFGFSLPHPHKSRFGTSTHLWQRRHQTNEHRDCE